jgi:hypothetical protein
VRSSHWWDDTPPLKLRYRPGSDTQASKPAWEQKDRIVVRRRISKVVAECEGTARQYEDGRNVRWEDAPVK